VAAAWARSHFGAGFFRIEGIAPDAVERDLAAFGIVERAVAAVVDKPEESESPEHGETV
jgi:hypothetical protein